MTPLTVPQAQTWRPEALADLAQRWDATARRLDDAADDVAALAEAGREYWAGRSADAAADRARELASAAAARSRAMIAASVAAGDGGSQIATVRGDLLDIVDTARRDGFVVADDGSVTHTGVADPTLVLLAGGNAAAAAEMLEVRGAHLQAEIIAGLRRLGTADEDAAADITAAMKPEAAGGPAANVPVGAVNEWPRMGQDAIAAQIAAMTAEQRDRLAAEFPREVGNTDGVPWSMRIAANRVNIAEAILAESGDDDGSRRRLTLYRDLLAEVDDPNHAGDRIRRQIIGFDPARASLIELHGDLASARGVAVLVPGVNTTIEGSAANTATARRFVTGSGGEAAVITYLGGPFPQVHNPLAVLLDAADPDKALAMAPRLVAFTEDVDRSVAPGVPVTVIGHSYGGSIVGTAETMGMTSDRTLFLAAAGAGVGVDDPSDWHNRNPDVVRFSMTAPGDFIEAVQGIPGGPHGADPDEMPGVIPLAAGRYDDGSPVAGFGAHSGMLNRPSDAWRTILAVITGD
ncbi:alpha/beta hydrolase [Mycobacterium sp. PSTR-4-N]|uniref:alpha/beta hydrolase n=1 Tax=Mycobacterium sp. PSTR-4-N TaxID=2917745 RepID=UPI001F149CEF|nr:alpha/beta hydrolase [Mycobacterium sp. PSTR-4-N]MCG7596127.1 alpha/beta hydrolase family protein [Mycobacterium sp. PSTR-4-N]